MHSIILSVSIYKIGTKLYNTFKYIIVKKKVSSLLRKKICQNVNKSYPSSGIQ